jgi:acetyl esterase/lipase
LRIKGGDVSTEFFLALLVSLSMTAKNINTIRRRWVTGLLGVLLAACKPVALLNAIIPTGQMEIERDVPFGVLPRQKLDIYQPRLLSGKSLPVVLFFYGGSWDSGSKQDYLFVAEALTAQGYLTVIADYRLYPEVNFPQLMQDPALAFKWVKKHIANYHGDPKQIFIMGHSAGAHLAVMLSLNAEYLAAVGLRPDAIAGTIGLAGAYDFLPLTSDRLKAIFAPAEQEWISQPINFANGGNPPLLLLTGTADRTVWPKNSINLAHAIEAKGGQVQLMTYQGYDHVDIIAKLARPLRGDRRLLEDIVGWLRFHRE